jgi:hypothetical protein
MPGSMAKILSPTLRLLLNNEIIAKQTVTNQRKVDEDKDYNLLALLNGVGTSPLP